MCACAMHLYLHVHAVRNVKPRLCLHSARRASGLVSALGPDQVVKGAKCQVKPVRKHEDGGGKHTHRPPCQVPAWYSDPARPNTG